MKKTTPDASQTLLSGYLTTEQLAKELGISPRTIYRWSMHRYGPPKVKIGWRLYYRRNAVMEWIHAREVTQVAAGGVMGPHRLSRAGTPRKNSGHP